MSGLYPRLANSPAIFLALAILFTICYQITFDEQYGVLPDCVCWMVLYILFTQLSLWNLTDELATSNPGLPKAEANEPSTCASWVVAGGIACSSWLSGGFDIFPIYPLLSPILMGYETRSSDSALRIPQPLKSAQSNLLVSIAIALFQSLVLAHWHLPLFLSSVLVLLVLWTVYRFIRYRTDFFTSGLKLTDLYLALKEIPGRVVVLLIIISSFQVLTVPYILGHVVSIILSGLFKGLSWYYNMQLALNVSAQVVPSILVLSVVFRRGQFLESSRAVTLSQAMTAVLALGNLHYQLPKNMRHKFAIGALSSLPLVSFVINIFMLNYAQMDIKSEYGGFTTKAHIENSIAQARIDHDNRLSRQSRSYDSACQEYQKRYHIAPPPGYGNWYAYATKHNSPIIDEFDLISKTTSPFLRFSGRKVSDMIDRARHVSDIDLWYCAFATATGKTLCTHPSRTNDRHINLFFNEMLAPLQGILPDVRFLVNHLDEPRVLLPVQSPDQVPRSEHSFNLEDLSHQNTWNAVTKPCVHGNGDRKRSKNLTFPLINNLSQSIDLCHHPEYRRMHGLLQSPTTFKLINAPLPVLSTGSLSSMNDILFPSPAYSELPFAYNEKQDLPWERKDNTLFWTGSTTGGFSSNRNDWRLFHRQRFVMLVQRLQSLMSLYWERKSPDHNFFSHLLSLFVNRRALDVAFTKISQCEDEACKTQRSNLLSSPTSAPSRIYSARLLFDLDGNGISGRFYKFLASRSLPLKQTLLEEWHNDRLVPWLHYVPISMEMRELKGVVYYFLYDHNGRTTAREVAEEGRKWSSQAMREVDKSIYTYRLMLELVRLQDLSRKAVI